MQNSLLAAARGTRKPGPSFRFRCAQLNPHKEHHWTVDSTFLGGLQTQPGLRVPPAPLFATRTTQVLTSLFPERCSLKSI